VAVVGFDPNLLMSYYTARLPLPAGQTAGSASSAQANKPTPPWDLSIPKPAQEIEDVKARNSDPYFDPKDTNLFASGNTGTPNAKSEIEALLNSSLSSPNTNADSALSLDNDKMFALYQALDRLDYIANMANRDGTVDGQRPGLDKSFQDGLNQILSYVKGTSFSNLSVLTGQKTATTQSAVSIAYPQSTYQGGTVVDDKHVLNAVPNVSASDSFTISITKAGVTTDVAIDLSNVSGDLTLDNINAYVNQQLAAAGFSTRFGRAQTGGSLTDRTATWGEKIDYRPGETVTLSSSQASASLYIAGISGKPTDSAGKLIKLENLDTTPTSTFSKNIAPDSGTATAKATAVDSNGNVYVIGDTTGSFGNEVNQASQDVYLTKYDSAGNVQWTKLLGSSDTASAYGLAVDPTTGQVVVAGGVTDHLTPTAIGRGTDNFVAKYDGEGNQLWLRQVASSNNDQANSVSIDSAGNVYVGGQLSGALSGQTSAGGVDASLTKLSSKGALVYQRQFGTANTDTTAKTAIADDGNVLVASVQDGHAILSKFNAADGTSQPMWQMDLGDLQGGTIGGLTVSNGKVYVSGTTSNAALNAGGTATVANASAGGSEAFVFAATDNGANANADFVSYVGTSSSEQGGGIVAANGKLYVTGTTGGTFSGQIRNAQGTHNAFVAQLGTDGTVDWTQQYGGLDGESKGLAIAADNSGASVLDALGLPRGKIDLNQSNAIESQTTARAGDYFTLAIKGQAGTRNVKITISKGETIRSLALKINGALLFDGKAQSYPVSGGQALKISVNQGVQVQLLAGPKELDALKGLGLKPQILINDTPDKTDQSKTSDSNATSNSSSDTKDSTDTTSTTIGLGINSGLNLLTKQDAAHANVQLQAAMALIKQAYGQLNNPPSATPATSAAPAPAYLQTQLAGYQTALAWLQSMNTQ